MPLPVERIRALMAQTAPELVGLRRDIHAHPELSGEERRTSGVVLDRLSALGLGGTVAGGTGVVASIRGGRRPAGGRPSAVALRADMDALPIQDRKRVGYASTVPGVMHACGHDGHVAMLVGAATILVALADSFAGEVRLLFQPAEEKLPGGAALLVEEGVLEGVDAVVGAHVSTMLPLGRIWCAPGPMMASADEFTITLTGKGGHGSMPHQGVDALLAGAQVVVALQSVVSRLVDPLEPAVLSVGVFQSGYNFNVIADKAFIRGTTRSLGPGVRRGFPVQIERILKGVCEAAGVGYELKYDMGYPPLVTDPRVTARVRDACAALLGADALVESRPIMGAEDFSHYLGRVPGSYMFIGAADPTRGPVYPHHHPEFDFDEGALPVGAGALAASALALLG